MSSKKYVKMAKTDVAERFNNDLLNCIVQNLNSEN